MCMERLLLPCPWSQRCRHIGKRLCRVDWAERFYTCCQTAILGIAFIQGVLNPSPDYQCWPDWATCQSTSEAEGCELDPPGYRPSRGWDNPGVDKLPLSR